MPAKSCHFTIYCGLPAVRVYGILTARLHDSIPYSRKRHLIRTVNKQNRKQIKKERVRNYEKLEKMGSVFSGSCHGWVSINRMCFR